MVSKKEKRKTKTEGRYERMPSTWPHLYKVQEWLKLTQALKSSVRGHPWRALGALLGFSFFMWVLVTPYITIDHKGPIIVYNIGVFKKIMTSNFSPLFCEAWDNKTNSSF